MKKVKGFNESCGKDLIKKEYIDSVMRKVALQYAYNEIVVPIIEDARAYSEDYVGYSPWPEWNRLGCFFFDISNYDKEYKGGEKQQVLLIPEGTVSVSRWLANQIEDNQNFEFPIKLFYSLNCYRNELLSTLSNTKRREFKQFGLEILGSSNPQSDTEILCLITTMLAELSVPINCVVIRLNDVRIFEKLIQESKIDKTDSIELKSLLDRIAEARAGKHSETLDNDINNVYCVLNRYNLDSKTEKRWKAIVEHKDYDLGGIIDLFDDSYSEYFESLLKYQSTLKEIGVNVKLDPCVIRSHEYYTGISFEIDVITENNSYYEIAGGGRYDRLVGNFLTKKNNLVIPCTGFAFGTERVLELLNDLNCFDSDITLTRKFYFDADYSQIELSDSSIEEYVSAFKSVQDFPVNIKFGDK